MRLRLLLIVSALYACKGDVLPRARQTEHTALARRDEIRPDSLSFLRLEPLFTLEGGVDPFYQVNSAFQLRDGTIVVGNGSGAHILFFDGSGSPLRVAGGRGEGPMEFERLAWVQRYPGDSIAAYDSGRARILVFTQMGVLARVFRLDPGESGTQAMPIGFFTDGSVLGIELSGLVMKTDRTMAFRDTVHYHRYSRTGNHLKYLARYPGGDRLVVIRSQGRRSQRLIMNLPFGRSREVGVRDGTFIVGDGTRPRLYVISMDGTREREIELPWELRAVSAVDIDSFRRDLLDDARSPNAKRSIRRRLAEMPFPPRFPGHGEIRVAAGGNIWVSRYLTPGDESRLWFVMSPAGDVLGRLTTPRPLSILWIGRQRVIGKWVDPQTDVESVIVYAIEPGAAGPGVE